MKSLKGLLFLVLLTSCAETSNNPILLGGTAEETHVAENCLVGKRVRYGTDNAFSITYFQDKRILVEFANGSSKEGIWTASGSKLKSAWKDGKNRTDIISQDVNGECHLQNKFGTIFAINKIPDKMASR